jgi:hypothetical protein
MSKNGLGKGLGELMEGDHAAGKPRAVSSASTTATSSDETFGRGLTTLISAHRSNVEEREIKKLVPSWFFFAADLLLLAYVIAITFDAPRPFDFGTISFCAASIALGCVLALVGVIRATGDHESESEL